MAILKRIVSEFLLAFVLALAWALFRAWPFRAEWTWLGGFLANFGAAFFFVSYFTGQFVRVKRQTATEGSFQSLRGEFGELKTVLQALTTKIDESPLAKDFADLTARANAQLAQISSTADKAFSDIRMGLPWQSEWPSPPDMMMRRNEALYASASPGPVPTPPVSPNWPPPNRDATGKSN